MRRFGKSTKKNRTHHTVAAPYECFGFTSASGRDWIAAIVAVFCPERHKARTLCITTRMACGEPAQSSAIWRPDSTYRCDGALARPDGAAGRGRTSVAPAVLRLNDLSARPQVV